jgi:hypothetical protein
MEDSMRAGVKLSVRLDLILGPGSFEEGREGYGGNQFATRHGEIVVQVLRASMAQVLDLSL